MQTAARTTVLFTTSPLVLDRADDVAYVEDGRVVAVGSHADLLTRQPNYRGLVTRGESDDAESLPDPPDVSPDSSASSASPAAPRPSLAYVAEGA